MRISYNREDVVIGFFIVFGISYPFFTALLIFLEDVSMRKQAFEEVRSFYSFVLGRVDCSEGRAEELARLMSEELARDMGGSVGLVRSCRAYKTAFPFATVDEKKLNGEEVVIDLVQKEKGRSERLLTLKLLIRRGEDGIKVEKIEYEKGS